MIYFVQDETTRRIKIGFTEQSASNRVSSLQTGSSSHLTLLAVFDGDRDWEGILHKAFADLRVCGEWFEPGPNLIRFLMLCGAQQGWVHGMRQEFKSWGFRDSDVYGMCPMPPVGISEDGKAIL